MKTVLEPQGDRIVVRRIKGNEVRKSGLVLPRNREMPTHVVEVVSVGDGYFMPDGSTRPLLVRPGDTVIVGERFLNNSVEIDEETFYVLTEREVLVKLKNVPELVEAES